MRLHLLGIPHTVTRSDFSHCAFTGKVQRFSPMLRTQGFDVVHYGVEGSESGATEDVVLMTEAEHVELLGHPHHEQPKGFYGDDAQDGSPLYRQWNYACREELKARLRPGDVVALPFGWAHAAAIRDLPLLRSRQAGAFESGVGYRDCHLPWRVYESEAQRHTVMAAEGRAGVAHDTSRLEWVVPNYYDRREWRFEPESRGYVAFFGRINAAKGVDLVPRLAAERPDLDFVLCGQGDPTPFMGRPNVHYRPPLKGAERAKFLGEAVAIIAPSRFVEPFCGAVVEAALCGTPALTSVFGAFTETVEHGRTGFRCQTLRHWLDGLDAVKHLSRRYTSDRALSRYSLEAVGPQYKAVLADIADNLVTAP